MIIFELLSLSEPYEGCKMFEISDMILAGKRPNLPNFITVNYPEFKDLFMYTTSLDPSDRPDMDTVVGIIKAMPHLKNPDAYLFK